MHSSAGPGARRDADVNASLPYFCVTRVGQARCIRATVVLAVSCYFAQQGFQRSFAREPGAGPGNKRRAVKPNSEWPRTPMDFPLLGVAVATDQDVAVSDTDLSTPLDRPRLSGDVVGSFYPNRQPRMAGYPLGGAFPRNKRAKIVHRSIRPDDLHAPDAAHLNGQQDRGHTLAWVVLWRHRQNHKSNEIENGAARVVPRRLAPVSGLIGRNAPS